MSRFRFVDLVVQPLYGYRLTSSGAITSVLAALGSWKPPTFSGDS